MKPPKEPKTWKYPRLYMRTRRRACLSEDEVSTRLIIIYPNGVAEWSRALKSSEWEPSPCWYHPLASAEENRLAMMKLNVCGFGNPIFIGEIK